MEILSPVGAYEQLIAAVRSGANAIYLGTKNFNARRNANNFDNDTLAKAIQYCHARDVKVYITLNTIITDDELEAAATEIENVARLEADAVIVQDLAMYKLVKEIVPDMPIHASTQMSVHNPSGVKLLEKMGFKRVVPARELTFEELKNIRDNTDIEMEVFVHGALCMCISGQCYLSSVLGQRSANRGLCAQPCRLDFKSENGNFALSLKDLSIITKLNSLESIGINSAKIEGRMKRPEYVAAATSACKNAIENKAVDVDTLRAVFSRSGFTDAYLTGKRDRDLFGYRTKEDVISASSVLKQISNEYRNEKPLIPIFMKLYVKCDKHIKLEVTDRRNTVIITGDIPEKAIKIELNEESAKRSLEKCGGTPYYTESIEYDIDKGLSVSVSHLNNLRKQALEELTQKRYYSNNYSIKKYTPQYETIKLNEKQYIYARFEKANQVCDEADKIILDYEEILNNSWLSEKYGKNLIAELPSLMFDEKNIYQKLKQIQSLGIETIYAPNLYAISISKELGFKIMGGFGLNIINSLALAEYKKIGLDLTEISFESTLEMFDNLNKCIPCGLIVYGKMPLMTFRACPIKTDKGCNNCNGAQSITDRFGNDMTILCKNKQYSRLLNPKPIYMGDKKSQLKKADFLTIYFTDETQEECRNIIRNLKNGNQAPSEFTRGLYYKKIK